jgi:hypothetical protein
MKFKKAPKAQKLQKDIFTKRISEKANMTNPGFVSIYVPYA